VSAFTPGTWKHVIHEKDGEQKHVVETGPPSWVPIYPDGVTDEEIAATCDLIAAAPDLLSALRPLSALLPRLFDALDLDLETGFKIRRTDDESSLYEATLGSLLEDAEAAIARATTPTAKES